MHKILIKFISLFILIIAILINTEIQAKDLAVMLYINDQSEGDNIYNQHLKDLGLSRNLNPNSSFNFEYHVTIGYIKNVDKEDVNEIKKYLDSNLRKKLDTNFEFGSASLLGCASHYIVVLPKKPQAFIEYNQMLYSLLKQYKNGKYTLDSRTMPSIYIPHLSLNGKVHKNVQATNINNMLIEVNKRLFNTQIKLNKLEIR